MTLKRNLIAISLFLITLTGCKDDVSAPTLSSDEGFSMVLPYNKNVGDTLTFTASDSWTIPAMNNMEFTLSQTSGRSGTHSIIAKASEYNCGNSDVVYSFTISSNNEAGTVEREVDVRHRPVFDIDTLYYEAKATGDTLSIRFVTDADVSSNLYVYYDTSGDFESMWNTGTRTAAKAQLCGGYLAQTVDCAKAELTRGEEADNVWYATIYINPNRTSRMLNGNFYFSVGKSGEMHSEVMQVIQEPSDSYTSKDMTTDDGKVTQLLKHTKGNGVPVVILGDGFLDKDIADGTFRNASNRAVNALFAMHPMANLKEYFDVYEVTAVSYNNYFTTSSNTAFGSWFASGNSTEISGDDDKVMEYAFKAVDKGRKNDILAIVLINDTRYAGTCVVATSGARSEIPSGYSIAYVPLSESEYEDCQFANVLVHEAVGHGFAKLADEYAYVEYGKISQNDAKEIQQWQSYGFYRNVAFQSDVTQSYWAEFAADSSYDFENLGCYEGAYGYVKGIYRPTEESVMDENTGGFNAPGRMMIFKRCMNIALGNTWKYSYDEFAEFDLRYAKTTASSAKRRASESRNRKFIPLAAPKMVR